MAEFIIYTVIISLLLAGIGFRLQYGTKAEIEQRRSASRWPRTTGTVTSSSVEEKKRSIFQFGGIIPFRTISSNLYRPVVQYTYQVNGIPYQSSRYRNDKISRSGEWMGLNPQNAEKIISDYPAGKTVTVFYNPEDPGLAYLTLDLSVTGQTIFRAGGLLLMAAAVGLLGLGAFRVSQSLVSQSETQKIPAAIPENTENIKEGLARELQMTCQAKQAEGERMVYLHWECSKTNGEKMPYIFIYSRNLTPEKVDAVHVLTGQVDRQEQINIWMKVAGLVSPTAASPALQDWLEKSAPTLAEVGSETKISMEGVQFSLSNPYGMGLVLNIGEIK